MPGVQGSGQIVPGADTMDQVLAKTDPGSFSKKTVPVSAVINDPDGKDLKNNPDAAGVLPAGYVMVLADGSKVGADPSESDTYREYDDNQAALSDKDEVVVLAQPVDLQDQNVDSAGEVFRAAAYVSGQLKRDALQYVTGATALTNQQWSDNTRFDLWPRKR